MQTVLKSRSKSNLNERLTNIMSTNIEKQMTVIEKNFALFGNCCIPFIGLFGIWGIMNSFQSNDIQRKPNMIVAPGIAEALFATADSYSCCSSCNKFNGILKIL